MNVKPPPSSVNTVGPQAPQPSAPIKSPTPKTTNRVERNVSSNVQTDAADAATRNGMISSGFGTAAGALLRVNLNGMLSQKTEQDSGIEIFKEALGIAQKKAVNCLQNVQNTIDDILNTTEPSDKARLYSQLETQTAELGDVARYITGLKSTMKGWQKKSLELGRKLSIAEQV